MDSPAAWLVNRIHGNPAIISFLILLQCILLKLIVISLYSACLYFMIMALKKYVFKAFSVWSRYYMWYVMAFCFILINLEINSLFTGHIQFYISSSAYRNLFFYFVSMVWLFVFFSKMLRDYLMNRAIVSRLKSSAAYDDDKNLSTLAKDKTQVNRSVIVLITADISFPASYGVIKQYILIPYDYAERYTDEELYLILLHEYNHIKNGDTIKIRLLSFLKSLLWFNPIVYLFEKQLKLESEILSDNNVLYWEPASKDVYSSTLLMECVSQQVEMTLPFSQGYHSVKTRIDRIYNNQQAFQGKYLLLNILIPIILLLNSIFYYTELNDFSIYNKNHPIEFIAYNAEDDTFVDVSNLFDNNAYFIDCHAVYIDKPALGDILTEISNLGYTGLDVIVHYFSKSSPNIALISTKGSRLPIMHTINATDDEKYDVYPIDDIHLLNNAFLFLLGIL